MNVQTIDNRSRKLLATLSSAIEQSSDTRIAVAFVSHNGLDLLMPAVHTALRNDAEIEFLVGLDRRISEPEALLMLHRLSHDQPKLDLYCYVSRSQAELYHPKVYLTRNEQESTAIVGSSNLTAGGLGRNVEVNVAITGLPHDEAIADMYEAYQRLKFAPQRVTPDADYLQLYKELFAKDKRQHRKARAETATRELEQAFKEKAQSLRGPTRKKKDLVGWLDLVYDRLPDGEFTNQEAYALEAELQEYYPVNLHIPDKIRQQLQNLRDLGFLEHVARGRWRKV